MDDELPWYDTEAGQRSEITPDTEALKSAWLAWFERRGKVVQLFTRALDRWVSVSFT